MIGQLRDININMISVCACVYKKCGVHFFRVLDSNDFHTKEETSSLT